MNVRVVIACAALALVTLVAAGTARAETPAAKEILEKMENSETLSKSSRRDEGIEWTAEEQRDWLADELRNLTLAG